MSRIGTKIQGFVAAAAVGAALSVAAPASALTLLHASMDTSNQATIKGGIYGSGGIRVYDGPITFTANDGGDDFSFTAFCIDIYHDIHLGSLNLEYHEEPLLTDSSSSTASPAQQNGIVLTLNQLDKIGALVNYGAFLTASGASDLSHKLAAVQGAIWQVEYGPTYTVSVSSAVQPYFTDYVADAAVASYMPAGPITTIFANDYGHQAFAFAAGVPEPAAWLMMIMGFGGIGASLRRRRQRPATAFA